MRKEPRERNSHKKYALNRIDFDFLKGFLHLYIKEVLTFWSDQKEHKQMCLTAYKQWCLYLFTVDFLFFSYGHSILVHQHNFYFMHFIFLISILSSKTTMSKQLKIFYLYFYQKKTTPKLSESTTHTVWQPLVLVQVW